MNVKENKGKRKGTDLVDDGVLLDDGAAGDAEAVPGGGVVLDDRPAALDAYLLQKNQKDNGAK